MVGTGKADAPEKRLRDAYGEFPHTLISTNFALKWGPVGDVANDDARALLDALEATWAAEIDGMGNPVPAGSDVYRMNVYIGSTGAGTPEALPYYAYASHDPEGYPTLIYSTERVADVSKSVNSAAHEFFHTVQSSIGTLDHPQSAWWFEATATWMAEEVSPETFDAGYLPAIGSYAMLPHVSLLHAELPQLDWQLIQGHHYGAFVFCRYLSDHIGDSDLIRRSFVEAGSEADALRVLDRLLRDSGIDLVDAFGAFAARNASWDYADGARYRKAVDLMAAAWPERDHRIAADVPAEGVPLRAAPVETLPEHAGYNLIRMAHAPAGSLEIELRGATAGSAHSPASFRATVVVDPPGDRARPSYLPVSLTAGGGKLELSDLAEGAQVTLVVAAWSWSAQEGEVFPYQYAFKPR